MKHVPENQLPASTCASGILHVEIPGWCMGANSSYGMTEKGHMFFVRDNVQAGAGTRISTEFQNLVLLPMVERARESEPLNHGGSWRPGQPTPGSLELGIWKTSNFLLEMPLIATQ